MIFFFLYIIIININCVFGQFEVIVLAYNRPSSLKTCLNSLKQVKLLDQVPLTIYIDGPIDDLTLKTKIIAENFESPGKVIVQRESNYGVFNQWFNSWSPKNPSSYALILEDDVILSKEFYSIIKPLIKIIDRSKFYGISLQRAQWQLGITEKGTWRRLDLVDDTRYPKIFGYPAIGTWGQVLFAEHWISFKKWYLTKSNVKIDGLIHEKWRTERRGDIWSYWYTTYALENGIFNAYFNLPNKTALAISNRDKGKYSSITLGPSGELYLGNEVINYDIKDLKLYNECFEQINSRTFFDYWNGERDICILDKSIAICKAIRCFYKPGRYPH